MLRSCLILTCISILSIEMSQGVKQASSGAILWSPVPMRKRWRQQCYSKHCAAVNHVEHDHNSSTYKKGQSHPVGCIYFHPSTSTCHSLCYIHDACFFDDWCSQLAWVLSSILSTGNVATYVHTCDLRWLQILESNLVTVLPREFRSSELLKTATRILNISRWSEINSYE